MTAQDQIFKWVQGFELWKQELFRRTSAAPELSDSDVREVAAILLGESTEASAPLEVTREELPGAEGAEEPMTVRSLTELKNVNAIDDGQAIEFEPGLNIVYGRNGAGKTGYSRILKHAGRTLRRETILANVATPGPGSPSATVGVTIGDRVEHVPLDLEAPGPALLGRICIADADACEIYLTSDTEVDYVPASLASVRRLGDGLKALDAHLKTLLDDAAPTELDLRPYGVDTAVTKLLGGLTAETPNEVIVAISTLSEAEQAQRQELRKKRAAVEASETPKLRAALEREAASAEALRSACESLVGQLGPAPLDDLKRRRTNLQTQRQAADLAAKEFAEEPLAGVGSDPWRSLWQAAREFAVHLGQDLPSGHDPATCPLCMQELDAAARDRFQRFEDFVRNDVNAKREAAEIALKQSQDALPDLEQLRARHTEAIERLGADPGEAGALTAAWLDRAEGLIARVREDDFAGLEALEPPPDQIGEWIAARRAEAAAYAELEKADDQERVFRELAELDARQLLGERRKEILGHLVALRRVAKITAAKGKLDKTGASRKLTDLSRELIQANLQEALNRQLKALDFNGLAVEAKSKSPGGNR
jgi:AAA domain